MVTVRNTRSTKTYLEQPRLVTCISRRWQKTLIPRFKSENHIDCFLNLSIKMSRDQRPTWVVPQLTDKMKNSLKDQIARKDMWVVGGTVFLVLLLPFQRYWDCLWSKESSYSFSGCAAGFMIQRSDKPTAKFSSISFEFLLDRKGRETKIGPTRTVRVRV